MARYRFHCTNGYECILDTKGADVREPAQLPGRARRVASRVMHDVADQADWSEWSVTVHDMRGRRVLLQPFVSASNRMALAA